MSTLEIVRADDLHLTSGQLAVLDPNWLRGSLRVTTAVKLTPGSYPVELAVIQFDQQQPGLPSRLVTAARVLVSSDAVQAWEPAWPKTKGGRTVAGGFGVDGGQACFVDHASVSFLAEYLSDDSRSLAVTTQVLGQQWTTVQNGTSDANAVVFSCGMGDGSYPVWLGHSEDGAIAQVAADLELLAHSDGPAD